MHSKFWVLGFVLLHHFAKPPCEPIQLLRQLRKPWLTARSRPEKASKQSTSWGPWGLKLWINWCSKDTVPIPMLNLCQYRRQKTQQSIQSKTLHVYACFAICFEIFGTQPIATICNNMTSLLGPNAVILFFSCHDDLQAKYVQEPKIPKSNPYQHIASKDTTRRFTRGSPTETCST